MSTSPVRDWNKPIADVRLNLAWPRPTLYTYVLITSPVEYTAGLETKSVQNQLKNLYDIKQKNNDDRKECRDSNLHDP
jgi:hypothetical protein